MMPLTEPTPKIRPPTSTEPRATQLGLLTPAAVRRGAAAAFAAAAVVGIYLVAVGGWPIALVGALSIVMMLLAMFITLPSALVLARRWSLLRPAGDSGFRAVNSYQASKSRIRCFSMALLPLKTTRFMSATAGL